LHIVPAEGVFRYDVAFDWAAHKRFGEFHHDIDGYEGPTYRYIHGLYAFEVTDAEANALKADPALRLPAEGRKRGDGKNWRTRDERREMQAEMEKQAEYQRLGPALWWHRRRQRG
jgi:hypothetical protein